MEGFLNPTEVLKQLKLKKDMTAADFGSGSGGWTIPLAKILEKGKVFAIDILEEPLSALRGKIKTEKIFNIDLLKADIERGTLLLNQSCDLVLMTNFLFQVEDIKKVLEEGKRVLKEKGEILVVDWKQGAAFGPEKKVLPDEVKKIAQEINLTIEKEFEAGPHHWGLILKKTTAQDEIHW
jgi:ubiquinone/menaquinone biosynthesis C-methylase UbiE